MRLHKLIQKFVEDVHHYVDDAKREIAVESDKLFHKHPHHSEDHCAKHVLVLGLTLYVLDLVQGRFLTLITSLKTEARQLTQVICITRSILTLLVSESHMEILKESTSIE